MALRVLSRRLPLSNSGLCFSRCYSRDNGGFFSWGRWFGRKHMLRLRRYRIVQFARPLIVTTSTLPFFSKWSHNHKVGYPSNPILPASVPVEVSRLMNVDDTNPSGNVHGGTVLKMIEQAGSIVAVRHCNKTTSEDGNHLMAVLARVDHMDFHQPMFVGEVAQLQAAVTYASPHSVEVTVDVWAENVMTGSRRHTNSATLWYVAVPSDVQGLTDGKPLKAMPVPRLEGLSEGDLAEGRKRYEAQKRDRKSKADRNGTPQMFGHYQACVPHGNVEEHTVLASQTTLSNIVLPSDCTVTGHYMGGPLMKIMDNAAGICAARHCRSHVVTACLDAIDFHGAIMNAEVVFVTARIVFTSAKSIEIEVTTESEGLHPGSRRITNTAYFTFVSLGKDMRAAPVPPLKVVNDEERERFEEGRKRYELRKKARQESLKQYSNL